MREGTTDAVYIFLFFEFLSTHTSASVFCLFFWWWGECVCALIPTYKFVSFVGGNELEETSKWEVVAAYEKKSIKRRM